jgi:hypothetical protein
MKMKLTIPVEGVVKTIPVSVRVWIGAQLFKVVEWLVSPKYVADLNLVEKAPSQ